MIRELTETLTHPDEATRLHVVRDAAGDHLVRLDTDTGDAGGIVIGVGGSREDAMADAISELQARIADLMAAR